MSRKSMHIILSCFIVTSFMLVAAVAPQASAEPGVPVVEASFVDVDVGQGFFAFSNLQDAGFIDRDVGTNYQFVLSPDAGMVLRAALHERTSSPFTAVFAENTVTTIFDGQIPYVTSVGGDGINKLLHFVFDDWTALAPGFNERLLANFTTAIHQSVVLRPNGTSFTGIFTSTQNPDLANGTYGYSTALQGTTEDGLCAANLLLADSQHFIRSSSPASVAEAIDSVETLVLSIDEDGYVDVDPAVRSDGGDVFTSTIDMNVGEIPLGSFTNMDENFSAVGAQPSATFGFTETAISMHVDGQRLLNPFQERFDRIVVEGFAGANSGVTFDYAFSNALGYSENAWVPALQMTTLRDLQSNRSVSFTDVTNIQSLGKLFAIATGETQW